MEITTDLVKQVWEQGNVIDGYPANMIRQDACGAWIRFDMYGDRRSVFGWEIDHIYPEKLLQQANVPQEEIDALVNLRPMQWQNNVAKGDNYPQYKSLIVSDDKKNKIEETLREVAAETQEILHNAFGKYLP